MISLSNNNPAVLPDSITGVDKITLDETGFTAAGTDKGAIANFLDNGLTLQGNNDATLRQFTLMDPDGYERYLAVDLSGNLLLKDSTLGGNVIVNEGGANCDFRVEGDTNENALFVDASSNTVGFGTGTPDANYQITSAGGILTQSGTNNFTGSVTLIATQTPATAGAAGVTGTIAYDANYIYICTATNTWRRVAHASW